MVSGASAIGGTNAPEKRRAGGSYDTLCDHGQMVASLRHVVVALTVLVSIFIATTPATAHVHVTAPPSAEGKASIYTVGVPNERPDAATVSVSLRIPANFTDVQALPETGWTASRTTENGATVLTWTGGRVEGSATAEFRFRATATKIGSSTIPAVQTYDDGQQVRWIGSRGSDYPAPVVTAGRAGTPAPAHTVSGGGAPPPSTTTAPTDTTVTATTATSSSGGIGVTEYVIGGLIAAAIVAGVLVALRRRPSDA